MTSATVTAQPSFTAEREALVDSQVRTNDVQDREVINAMLAVPREHYVPEARKGLAYSDIDIQTGPGRYLWQARDFSKLLQAAAIQPDETVLNIAPGTGYSSEVIARIAKSVVNLETADHVEALTAGLEPRGLTNCETVGGDLAQPVAGKGPFDVVFVNGSVEVVPEAWTAQLADGGRLAVVVRENGVGRARIYTRSGDKIAWRNVFEAFVPALPGFEQKETFRF
ncbi:MAG: protein-L-isoaspartate O-methyltransferase [Hyphomonadaceae bacterium]